MSLFLCAVAVRLVAFLGVAIRGLAMVVSNIDLEVTGVYAADDNSPENLLGRVTFTYTPSQLTPTTVTRSYKPQNSDKRKLIEVCVVYGASAIQVKGASIWNGNDGPYLSCDISLPREIRERVLAIALERLPHLSHSPSANDTGSSGRPSR